MSKTTFLIGSLIALCFISGCSDMAPLDEIMRTAVAASKTKEALTNAPIHYPLPADLKGDWMVIFEDDFNGNTLNTNRWTTCYWWDNNGCTISSNHEKQWYQPGNVSIEDSKLILQAKQETIEASDGKTYPFTSGMVTSGHSTHDSPEPPGFAFQYGYAEIRARVPSGKGLWPAFWLLPTSQESKPEIDVMEILGDDPREVKMFYHYIGENEMVRKSGRDSRGPDYAEGWHTYGVNWSPDELVWYIDGREKNKFTQSAFIPQEPMYLIINLAVGGNYPGDPDESTPFPSAFEVDFVRVYQRVDTVSLQPIEDTYIELATGKKNTAPSGALYSDGQPNTTMLLKYDTQNYARMRLIEASIRVHTTEDEGSTSTSKHNILISDHTGWQQDQISIDDYEGHEYVPIGVIDRATSANRVYDFLLDIEELQTYLGTNFTIAINSEGDDGLYLYSTESRRGGIQLLLTFAQE